MISKLSSPELRSAVFVIMALLLGIAPASAAEKVHFKVRISIVQSSLRKTSLFKRYGQFFVDTTIINTGAHDEHITVWTQSGWSWLSNDADISPGIEALKNLSTKIVLMPGQKYAQRVEMWASRKLDEPVAFRLGFVPNAALPVSGNRNRIKDWGGIYWSNSVTLNK